MSTVIFGATGLCGSAFLKQAEQCSSIIKITTITRKELKGSNKLTSIVDTDSSQWRSLLDTQLEKTDICFSGLGTTRAAAGGFLQQYAIDHDLNLELAKVAKAKGVSTFVLVSSSGANENSYFPYMKMKGEIERDIIALGFDKTIILRPGILLGERGEKHKGFGNNLGVMVGNWFHRTRFSKYSMSPVFGEEVAKAGLKMALESNAKVRIVESEEILNMTK